jgi:hypothetical protein
MPANDDEPELVNYPYAYHGVVVDNADPDGRHRVRVRIAGIIDPQSGWCYPLTAGGGSAQRGGHVVPAIGADVVVWMIGGHVDFMVYMCGWWKTPAKTGTEMGTFVKDAGDQAHLVSTYELGNLLVVVDERPGQRQFSISDKTTGMGLVMDLEKQGIVMRGLTSILIKACIVRLEGAQLTLNERCVTSTGKAI